MEIRTSFGANLKRYRKAKRFSQEQLAEGVDISVRHLSKIERGLTFVSADLLGRIAAHLDISVAQLFCKASEKIYDDNVDNVLSLFDRISEKHLIRALEGIKADIRQNYVDK